MMLFIFAAVNFYGMIQTTKAFLPILKRQSCSGMHGNARVINMVSMAGLVTSPGLSSYHSSKFAAEAFSSCLRMELKGAFDIDVITVNPSYHQTPIIENLDEKIDYTWNNASSEKKKEYGIGEYTESCFKFYQHDRTSFFLNLFSMKNIL